MCFRNLFTLLGDTDNIEKRKRVFYILPTMEYIKSLNLYVDWEKGKIYRKREKGFLDNLLGLFGNKEQQEEMEEITSKDAELKVKKYKLLELYAIAKKLGKTELKETINGQEVRVKIEPDKVVVETPELVMEYTAEKFILRNKKTGEVQEKEPTLQEFYQMYKEIRKLLGAGSVENYLHLKAREPEFKQQYAQMQGQQGMPMQNQQGMPFAPQQQQGGGFSWGSALLGLGGGMLLGYLLGSMMGDAFAHEVQTAPPLSPEEQQQVEQAAEAPAEEVIGAPVEEVVQEEITIEEIPEPSLEDVQADLGNIEEGDYFANLDESVLDSDSGSDFAEAGGDLSGEDLAQGDDFGGFDDFDGGDFDV